MPLNQYIKITIDGQILDLGPIGEIPLRISYSLEDRENFQQKNASKAIELTVPATLLNGRITNSWNNPSVEDMTVSKAYRNTRRGIIEANGQELLVGKAFLLSGTKSLNYKFSLYGNNADWLIDLKETTLYDFVKDISFLLHKPHIVASWNFDGLDINMPYVFAPVRYSQSLETLNGIEDYNMLPEYMKPALSKYWIIYKALKSLGYTIKSDFMDSSYFRRQVMPWTWGNFLFSAEGSKLDSLDFLAKSIEEIRVQNRDYHGILDLKVTNETINGAFDNNSVYNYNQPKAEMNWVYPTTLQYGLLSATFHLNLYVDAQTTSNSDIEIDTYWYKNGVQIVTNSLLTLWSPDVGSRTYMGFLDDYFTATVNPGDRVSCVVFLRQKDSRVGKARLVINVETFQLDYITIPLGGTINFTEYTGFKKYKFQDFLSGVVDEFNLNMQTDSVNKIVYFEPQHPYSTVDDQSVKQGGYFNGKFLDWTHKQDVSKESDHILFSDYEKELNFKYKDDANDGTYNIVQNRNVNKPALAKYVFPDRFQAGKREIENRFFSAVMHFDVMQWANIAFSTPQMICLIPENVSNTSKNEAENTFEPKSAYYKGLEPFSGWVFDGEQMPSFPYMFAVNYKPGGEDDPILSYCDEQIGTTTAFVMGKGLLRRFYLQRLEIMRNGQYLKTHIKLNNNDIANFLHREHVILDGQRWEVVEINNYNPISEESTEVHLRKWSPINA